MTVTFIRGGRTIQKAIPPSNEQTVIIPSNYKGTGFLRNMYSKNKKYIRGLITRKEFDDIIDTASAISAKAYSHNRKADV